MQPLHRSDAETLYRMRRWLLHHPQRRIKLYDGKITCIRLILNKKLTSSSVIVCPAPLTPTSDNRILIHSRVRKSPTPCRAARRSHPAPSPTPTQAHIQEPPGLGELDALAELHQRAASAREDLPAGGRPLPRGQELIASREASSLSGTSMNRNCRWDTTETPLYPPERDRCSPFLWISGNEVFYSALFMFLG